MQIDEAIIRKVTVHSLLADKTGIGGNELNFSTNEEVQVLRNLLLRPFASASETFEFTHEVNLDYNVAYDLCKNIYGGSDFSENSRSLAQHLISSSRHPKIKPGELLIAKFDELRMGNEYFEGVGIYKFDQKEGFLTTEIRGKEIEAGFQKGLGTRKPDKACLILFSDEPFTAFVLDNNLDGTIYWQSDFLNIVPKDDEANSTANVIRITKEFVDQLKEDPDLSGADRAHMLNRSIQYLQENETFRKPEFEDAVFGSYNSIEQFRAFGDDYRLASGKSVSDNFEIMGDIVRRQSRRIRSVLKLDKNFHIYVHGDSEMIERGVDSKGRKYYKLFYEHEE